MTRVLTAGATGQLGQWVLSGLKKRGYVTRATARDVGKLSGLQADEIVAADLTKPETLQGVCREVDFVISCAGASMNVSTFSDRKSFYEVDYQGNLNLLAEAKKSGIRKFVYVSLADGDKLRRMEYADAHEKFVDALRLSSLPYTVVRPTGFFSFHLEILKFANKGRGIMIGDGSSRTNPIHEADVARACVEALDRDDPEMLVGGSEIFTRKETVELAFNALGRKPSLISISPAIFKLLISPLKLINRRIHALMDFGVAVTETDLLAPHYGARRLRDYFDSAAKEL